MMTHFKHLIGALAGAVMFTTAVAATAPAAAVDPALLKRGEYVARAGDCIACHSAPGKPVFAGGVPFDSGHGIIYSTNITPDKLRGIGNLTEKQFADMVRKGVRTDGSYLYPAMPYPSYAKVSDADITALYAYFMTSVKPSNYVPPATSLSFPFNMRVGMKVWNWFFSSDVPFKAQPGWSADVTRGAYLVEGLGHCGSCHTPRGFAMNEKGLDGNSKHYLAGGQLGDWPIPSLRGLPRWDQAAIVDYLQTGRNVTGAVAGEMTSVVEHSTSHLSDSDLRSVAAYLKTLPPVAPNHAVKAQGTNETIAKLTKAQNLTLGERLYLDNCAACHFVTGKGAKRVFPQLDQASVINAENPYALLHVILAGERTPSTEKAPSILVMPGFAKRLNDAEAAALATFLRQAWTNTADSVSERDVKKVRATIKH